MLEVTERIAFGPILIYLGSKRLNPFADTSRGSLSRPLSDGMGDEDDEIIAVGMPTDRALFVFVAAVGIVLLLLLLLGLLLLL